MKSRVSNYIVCIACFIISSCDYSNSSSVSSSKEQTAEYVRIALDTINGYSFNPLTSDSIPDILNENGEIVKTGRVVQVEDSDWVRMPLNIQKRRAGKPIIHTHEMDTNNKLVGSPRTISFTRKVTELEKEHSTADSTESGVVSYLEKRVLQVSHPPAVSSMLPKRRDARNENFSIIDGDHGMLSEIVSSIAKDDKGNIWLAVESGGLARYDGERMLSYNKGNGLLSDILLSVYRDANGYIWFFGYSANPVCYNGSTFTEYTIAPSTSPVYISEFLEDTDGNMWIGTEGDGVFKVWGDSVIQYTEMQGLVSDNITSLLADDEGNLWLGGSGGLTKYDGKSFESFYLDKEMALYSSAMDQEGNLWFALVGHGVLKFDDEFELITKENGLISRGANDISFDSKGTLWIASLDGLTALKDEKFVHYTKSAGLAVNELSNLYIDENDIVWIGQRDGGLVKLQQNGISTISSNNGLISDQLTGAAELITGEKIRSFWGSGITITKDGITKQYTSENGLRSSHIRYVFVVEDEIYFHDYWAMGKFDGTHFYYFEKSEPKSGPRIYTHLDRNDGKIWVGSKNDGLGYLDKDAYVFLDTDSGVTGSRITAMAEDKMKNLWIGGPWGISTLNGNAITRYSQREGLYAYDISALTFDGQGKLWIGTNDEGIVKFDGKYFDRLVPNTESLKGVKDFLEDDKGRMWTASSAGLNSLISSGDTYKNYSITKETGVLSKEFKELYFSENDSVLYVVGSKGLEVIDTEQFNVSLSPPLVNLTSLLIDGNYIDFYNLTDSSNKNFTFDQVQSYTNVPVNLSLSPESNHITFEFAGIDWNAQNKIEYSYRLDPLESDWSNPTKIPRVDYRNIPSGDLTFCVKAKSESGEWSEPIFYKFKKRTPWWKTSTANAGYLILALFGVFGFIQFRTKTLRRRQQHLENEIELATKEIVSQKDRAEQSERYKEQFLANMSHEIRTPIHAISGMLKILKRNAHPEFQNPFLDAMNKSTDNLSKLLNDVLDLSKIESGKLTIVNEPFDLKANIRLSIELLQGKAEEKGLSLAFFFSEELPKMVKGDALRLTQILINLINNAIKFSEQGKITISVKPESNGIRFIVRDEGTGISEDDQQRIFKSFEQVQGQQAIEGTGLGLSITKQLIELQDGTLELTSEKEKGSEFTFTLPLQKYDGELRETVTSEEELQVIGKKLKPLKILLVEDTEFNVMVAKDDLSWYFPQSSVDVAMDGEEAFDMYGQSEYDLVLMDVQMPTMDGYQSTQKIRELELNKNLKKKPIIAMTASLLSKDIQKCIEAGMDDYLPKPYRSDELVLKIAGQVNK